MTNLSDTKMYLVFAVWYTNHHAPTSVGIYPLNVGSSSTEVAYACVLPFILLCWLHHGTGISV